MASEALAERLVFVPAGAALSATLAAFISCLGCSLLYWSAPWSLQHECPAPVTPAITLKSNCFLHYNQSSNSPPLQCVDVERPAHDCVFNLSDFPCILAESTKLTSAVGERAGPGRPCRAGYWQSGSGRTRVIYPALEGSWTPPPPLRHPGWQPEVVFMPHESERCSSLAVHAVDLVGWAQMTGIRHIVMSGKTYSKLNQKLQNVWHNAQCHAYSPPSLHYMRKIRNTETESFYRCRRQHDAPILPTRCDSGQRPESNF